MVEVFCYQHHIGKYEDSTRSLSLIQHGAYLRLIHLYYKLVGKLPNDMRALCRMLSCQSKAERDAVAYAVAEFFSVGEDGFLRNRGAEKELQRITKVSEENRRKANAKWLKDKKTHDATALQKHIPKQCREDANSSTHQLINSSTEDISLSVLSKNRFEEWWNIFPKQRIGSKQKALAAYEKALRRATEEEIHDGTKRYAASREVRAGYAKGAAAWLNDDRWTSDYSDQHGKQQRSEEIKQQLQEWVDS